MILIRMISVIALLGYLVLLLLVSRDLRRREVRSFAMLLLVMLVWQAGATGVSFTADPDVALFCYTVVIGVGSSLGLFYAQFTRDFLRVRTHGWIMSVGYVLAAGFAVWTLSGGPYVIDGIYESPESGLLLPTFGPLFYVWAVVTYSYFGYSAGLLVMHYRRATSTFVRSRIKYLLFGLSLVFLGSAANLNPTLKAYPVDMVLNATNAFLIAYAILRYQLLDITVVMRKGLLYSVLTAFTGITYFLAVFVALNLFHLVIGYQIFLLSLFLAALTAVAMQPLRDVMQSWVDRLFFREKYDSGLMLQRLSQMAASVLDLDRLTGLILEDVTGTMHINSGAFLIKEEVGGEYHLRAHRGIPDLHEGALSFRKDHPVVVWLATHRTSLPAQTLHLDPGFIGLWMRERQDLDQIKAEIFVPLLVRDSLMAVLVLGPKLAETPYTVDEQRSLTTLANQTAVAIENARLFSLEQQKVKTSSALLEVATAMSSTLDLSRMMELIARRTAEVCGFDRCSIFVTEDGQERLRLLVSQLVSEARKSEAEQVPRLAGNLERVRADTLLARLMRERHPMLVGRDAMTDLPADWSDRLGVKGLLAIPLISKDRVSGLMTLEHFETDRQITDDQVDLAVTIASQVSVAIENSGLYQEALAEKERTATIVEQAFAGMILLDCQLGVVSLNPAAEAIIGESATRVIGQPLSDIFGPNIVNERSSLRKAMSTGERVPPAEQQLVRGDRRRDVLLGVAPLRDGYLLSLADITQLKEVDRLKSDIIANVSHEFRTPLAIIKAYAELLMDDVQGENPASRHEFLGIIDAETDRLASMVSDLLDLARLEASQGTMIRGSVHISDVIDEALALLQFQARSRNIVVHVDAPRSLPELSGNRDVLTTLIRNLLGNAIKFSHPGGMVDVVAKQEDGSLVLRVIDQGIGIAEEDMPHLFEKFYRAKAAQEAGIRGTGLGLVLVKQAVEAHGATIAVESRRGEGARFTVTFPLPVDPAAGLSTAYFEPEVSCSEAAMSTA
jgi:PAS domain S-box-containing protein